MIYRVSLYGLHLFFGCLRFTFYYEISMGNLF